jgi:hypothetical protein
MIRKDSNISLPSYLSNPLIYVQYFRFTANPNERADVAMWTVERIYRQDQHGNCYRYGAVVPLADVTHAVELIPVYGEKADTNISSAVSLEHYKHFFLNSFADKESYHTFSTEFA